MKKSIPWLLVALLGVWVISALRPPAPHNGFELAAFGRLPVLLNGRIQPWDSVGRNALLQIRTRQNALRDERTRMPAREWLLELMTQPDAAAQRKVFRIDNGEVISLLHLPADDKYFSFSQLETNINEVEKQARQISEVEAAHRTPYQRHLLRLYNAIALYTRLQISLVPEGATNCAAELESYEKMVADGVAAFHARQAGKEFDQEKLDRFVAVGRRYDRMAQMAYPLVVPPLEEGQARNDWKNAGVSLMDTLRTQKVHPVLTAYAKMADAWRGNQPAAFNQAVAEYSALLDQKGFTKEVRKGRSEFFYQQSQGFYRALMVYVVAFVLAIFGLLFLALNPAWSEVFRRSSFALICLAIVVHTIGMVYRMALEGRPPVTNLYSSAVFIGWGAVVLGLILEWFFRVGIGNTVGSFVGFISLVVAHNLGLGGDTMEMMRAVLDSNFWLATHVVTITLGYSSAFIGGMIAALYIILGVFTPLLSRQIGGLQVGRAFSLMVYGIVCFTAFFSFIGTVLGGIWADQSWGRFWGWDPKENGALLIVIWYTAYLHARWGGILKERGLMSMAIFGNIVTAWSWFGVNMLGVGLHSYGFMDSAFKWLVLFAGLNFLLMLLCLIPESLWISFRKGAGPPALPETASPKSSAGSPA